MDAMQTNGSGVRRNRRSSWLWRQPYRNGPRVCDPQQPPHASFATGKTNIACPHSTAAARRAALQTSPLGSVNRFGSQRSSSFVLVLGRAVFVSLFLTLTCQAEWQWEADSIAWTEGTNVLWRFNYSPAEGKPFFDPLTAQDGVALTTFGPKDHPWHYGLWFSWKYINKVNYWEQDRTTGKAEGRTRWAPPRIRTRDDGLMSLALNLDYVDPTGTEVLKERRNITVSSPEADGSYTIDWQATFTAGSNAVVLDRTPMPNEPDGQVNGGYAGMSIRLAGEPVEITLVTTNGAITEFANNRARPDSPALAANCRIDGQPVGSVAMLSAESNIDEGFPWYAVMTGEMRFFCSAVLAPKPLTLAPGEQLKLTYRIIVRSEPWTPESLQAAVAEWGK